MVEFNPSRCEFPPRPYQVAGVNQLLKRPRYGLFWEMRLGKCKAVIDAACTLFDAGELDVVVVACPAQVKGVWLEPEFGEIQKHSFVEHYVRLDYRSKNEGKLDLAAEAARSHRSSSGVAKYLTWVVTSYEFLRQEDANSDFPKVEGLMCALRGLRWMLVCDETAALGNHKSLQHRAILRLRHG